jgi:hypothetical protein
MNPTLKFVNIVILRIIIITQKQIVGVVRFAKLFQSSYRLLITVEAKISCL